MIAVTPPWHLARVQRGRRTMGWCPYREADRRPHLTLVWEHLPESTGGGLYVRWGDGSVVVAIDPQLEGPARRDALTHELVHDERGGGACGRGVPRWRPERVKEEARVRSIVAERIVPVRRLARFCDRMADLGEGVGPQEVMDEFDCTRRVAEDALTNLVRHERGR